MTAAITVATLEAFSAAWNRHDIDALMSFMHPDCVFLTAAGDQACGEIGMGRMLEPEQIFEAVAEFMAAQSGPKSLKGKKVLDIGLGQGADAEQIVRRAPGAGRYVLTDTPASGPAMFDTARLRRAGDLRVGDADPIAELGRRATAAGLRTASLDEVLCVKAV